MKVNKALTLAVLACLSSTVSSVVQGAFDENLTNYTLDTYVVTSDRTKDQFGNTVTEQSYYRTGGDVKVITREEIEKRHYTDLTEAIKRIPGVTFQNPGYRGGEYGYQFFNNGVSINGDTRVIILVDGRRVDNAASTRISGNSSRGSKSTGVNLDQVTSIDAVDKIEVIKGPGASIYGSDATGGVINIITRKGSKTDQGTIDVSTGSWRKHNYSLTYSGSAGNDDSLHYFVALNRAMSGDTKYKDGHTGEVATLGGSRFKENGANIRIDKDFNDKQGISFTYNYKDGRDGYPISTPNMQYWNEKDWKRIIFNSSVGFVDSNGVLVADPSFGNKDVPGYHNLFALDGAAYHSFSKFRNQDFDLKYTFDKQADMESFIRLYQQKHRYSSSDKYAWYRTGQTSASLGAAYNAAFPTGATEAQWNQWVEDNLAPFPGGSKAALEQWVADTGGKAGEPTSYVEEKNRGIQVQYGRSLGKHDVLSTITYDRAYNDSYSNRRGITSVSKTDRTSVYGYVQDKIRPNDDFEITPAIRFAYYSDFGTNGTRPFGGKSHAMTPSLNLQYRFKDKSTVYAGWTNLLRPLRRGDYTSTSGIYLTPLDNEKGNAYTFGYSKTINDKTTVGVNYALTKMSNAIASFRILDRSTGIISSTAVNARENKKSFNFTVDHKINNAFRVGLAYSHLKDEWKAKSGYVIDPNWSYNSSGDINTGINELRPSNHYTLNASYDKGKLSSSLLVNWYTGANTTWFTQKRFLIIDLSMNYDVTKDISTYFVVNNLLNRAYETTSNSNYGTGSSAMPGRSFMVGAKYKF